MTNEMTNSIDEPFNVSFFNRKVLMSIQKSKSQSIVIIHTTYIAFSNGVLHFNLLRWVVYQLVKL
jgi:hypothetical protein